MRLRVHIAAAAAVVSLVLAAPAGATHVQCGDTITADTTLDSDIVCGPGQTDGLIIAGDDITLRLRGHRIVAGAAGADGGWGIRTMGSQPVSGVTINYGTIEGFFGGVVLLSDNSAVQVVTVSTITAGINMAGNGNYAYRNQVHITTPAGALFLNNPGVELVGDDAYAWGNVVTGFPGAGIIAQGERPRVVWNTIASCDATSTYGVAVADYSANAVVNNNSVSGCDAGVAALTETSTGGAKVRLNEITGGRIGINVRDQRASLWRNSVTGASLDGIFLEQPGVTVRENVANDNGRYGIFGPVGTVDGGGNTASGNGAPQQCVNVSCGP